MLCDISKRGGAGNIGSPRLAPTLGGKAHDFEVVPDTAIRKSVDGDYHTGVSSNLSSSVSFEKPENSLQSTQVKESGQLTQ
jgi:Protein of unknown function (DUF3602)